MRDTSTIKRRQFIHSTIGLGVATIGATRLSEQSAARNQTSKAVQLAGTPQSIELLVAPDNATLDSVSTIEETAVPIREFQSRHVPSESIAEDDAVVFKLEITDLDESLDTVRDLTDADGVQLTVEQTETAPDNQPYQWDLPAASHLVTDSQNDEYFVVTDTGQVEGTDERDGDGLPTSEYSEFEAKLQSNGGDDEGTVTAQFRILPRYAYFDYLSPDNRLLLPGSDEVQVTGTTTLAPGSSFTVEISNDSSGDSSFIRRADVTVDDDRTWEAGPFDFVEPEDAYTDTVEVGTQFTSQALENGVSLVAPSQSTSTQQTSGAAVSGKVVDYSNASVTLADQQTQGDVFTVESATLPEGGFVAIQHNGDIIGTSNYLDEGEHSDIRVMLDETPSAGGEFAAIAYVDIDHNARFNASVDRPYLNEEGPVVDSAQITVSGTEAETETETETRTVTETQTTTASPTTTSEPSQVTEGSNATPSDSTESRTPANTNLTGQEDTEEGGSTTDDTEQEDDGIPILDRFTDSSETVGIGLIAIMGGSGVYALYRRFTNETESMEDTQRDS